MEPISEDQIHAYVDGTLSEAERDAFEKRIQSDSILAEKVAAYSEQNSLMHELFDSVLDEEVPNRLTQRPSSRTRKRFFFGIAANIALLCLGGVIGWTMKDQTIVHHDMVSSLVRPATNAHMVYLPEVAHPVEVTAEQEGHLVKWLSKRLGKDIRAPELTRLGFKLVGGRLLPSENGPAAQFMYEDASGERLTLYVRNRDDAEQNTGFRFHQQDSTSSFYWIDGSLGYVLSGRLVREQMLGAATAVYQQMSM